MSWKHSRRSSRKTRRLQSDKHAQPTVLLLTSDNYVAERTRLALQNGRDFSLRVIDPDDKQFNHATLPDDAVAAMLPISALSATTQPLSLPVLAYGPPDLFDAVPGDLADDVIADTWSASELHHRLRKISRSEYTLPGGSSVTCAPFFLRAGSRTVKITPSQYRMARLLLRSGGGSVSRAALAAVAGSDGERSVDMHISRLRKRLASLVQDGPGDVRIVSDRGRGYAIVA